MADRHPRYREKVFYEESIAKLNERIIETFLHGTGFSQFNVVCVERDFLVGPITEYLKRCDKIRTEAIHKVADVEKSVKRGSTISLMYADKRKEMILGDAARRMWKDIMWALERENLLFKKMMVGMGEEEAETQESKPSLDENKNYR